jgi:hypothetical protein
LKDVLALCDVASDGTQADSSAVIRRDEGRERGPWHLLAPFGANLWVNGLPLLAGLRVLDDRDEIRVENGRPLFFATEELARVVPMPDSNRAMMCPRCQQRIDAGTAAVRCPRCALWHHESGDLPCWTYSPTCTLCPQPSALDAGFQWTPMEL